MVGTLIKTMPDRQLYIGLIKEWWYDFDGEGTIHIEVIWNDCDDTTEIFHEYEDYDDEDAKDVVSIPSSAPAADVSPQMAEAMKTFPQWTQEQIQGNFDQGWEIPSLLEWVNSQE